MFFSKSVSGLCSLKTGVYTGNAVDDRNIDIGVNLASKKEVYIIIKSISTSGAKHRIEYGQGDLTMKYSNDADSADSIQCFTSTGFQLGASVSINYDGILYRYIVFWVN